MISQIHPRLTIAFLAFLVSIQVSGDSLIDQHKKMMIDAITQCNPQRVKKLLDTPYVDPNEILNDQNQVNPPFRGLATESYASFTVKSNCSASVILEIWGALKNVGGDLNRGLGGMNPLQATLNRRSNIYELATFLLDAGINPQGNPPTYTVGDTNTSLVIVSYNAGWLTAQQAVKLIQHIGSNFAKSGIGNDINARNADGSTALLLAVFNRAELTVVESLVEQGADLTLRSPSDWSPHEILNYQGCEHISKSSTYNQQSAEYKKRNEELLSYFDEKDPTVLMVVHTPPCPKIYR